MVRVNGTKTGELAKQLEGAVPDAGRCPHPHSATVTVSPRQRRSRSITGPLSGTICTLIICSGRHGMSPTNGVFPTKSPSIKTSLRSCPWLTEIITRTKPLLVGTAEGTATRAEGTIRR